MVEASFFDEMWGNDEQLRPPYKKFQSWFNGEDPKRLRSKQREAEELFRLTGITFNVYGRSEAEERLIPFDIIPRVISEREWARVTKGIEQRVRAINAFLHDIYHKQEIIKAGRIPREMISQNVAFEPRMIGVTPPGGIYTHIVGIDLVRTGPDEFFVLEDNAHTPSGVSYMLVSFDSTLKANLTVGAPFDFHCYDADSLKTGRTGRVASDDAYFQKVSEGWGEALRDALDMLPEFTLGPTP